jgi:hypothetical protein
VILGELAAARRSSESQEEIYSFMQEIRLDGEDFTGFGVDGPWSVRD